MAVYLTPGNNPQIIGDASDLETLRSLVGGYIEAIYHWLPEFPAVFAYGNDEARCFGMPPSAIRLLDEQVICGPLVFFGDTGDGDTRPLTDEEQAALLQYLSLNTGRVPPAVAGDRIAYERDGKKHEAVVQDVRLDEDGLLSLVISGPAGLETIPAGAVTYNQTVILERPEITFLELNF